MSTFTILGKSFTLWCFDQESKVIFKVIIGENNDIFDLKELITKKLPGDLKAVQLLLWKVDIEYNKIKNITLDCLLIDKLENEIDTVGRAFDGIAESIKIRVILEKLVDTEKENKSINEEELAMLEFWKGLSKAKIIFPYIQNMLLDNSFFVIKNESELEFNLRPTVKDEYKDNKYVYLKDDVNMQIDDLLEQFNCDGFLCLPNKVFFLGNQSFGSHLLIRSCYLELIHAIPLLEIHNLIKYGCIITGTPGIGKSYFGLFLLYYIRHHYPDATIIWELADKVDQLYEFSSNGNVRSGNINMFRNTLASKKNFYLVDAQRPINCNAYTILFSSPNDNIYNVFKKRLGITKYYMPIWSFDEINLLWNTLYKETLREKSNKFSFEKFDTLLKRWGPIPRTVLQNWNNKSYVESDYKILIGEIDLERTLISFSEEGMNKSSASGRLIHIHVKSDFITPRYCFASRMITRDIIDRYIRYNQIKFRHLLKCTGGDSKVSAFRGRIFEDFAHQQIQKGGDFRIRLLTNGMVSMKNTITEYKKIRSYKFKEFYTLEDTRKNYYNVPTAQNFESIDSFSYDENTLFLYQVTVSMKHSIKFNALDKIKKFLDWDKDIYLYFVVPPEIFSRFPPQKYKNSKDEDRQKFPTLINKLSQYALEVPINVMIDEDLNIGDENQDDEKSNKSYEESDNVEMVESDG
ncbi:10118_t:CDS:2 [Funneliformis geosporum]|uniref:11147_t:CDS:1 n=1 Tax=Funneliformis geosporum TaxID=1117311 RepID=A0A9W4SFA5_9GLOM|nr:10118_t:CDS:2 [Funneliformis geosporum]CAI2166414.1 11147_t:CDS:2 [Funneliformis geosporum]